MSSQYIDAVGDLSSHSFKLYVISTRFSNGWIVRLGRGLDYFTKGIKSVDAVRTV